MDRPTVVNIKTWSKVDFSDLDESYDDTQLAVLVTRACDYVEQVTGRLIDASFPPALSGTCQDAVQRRVEQVAYQTQPDYVETGADDQVVSFTASSYSETRRDDPARARGQTSGRPKVNPWGALNDLLWLLMTDDMRDYWLGLLSGINTPAFEVTEVDWAAYNLPDSSFVWGP